MIDVVIVGAGGFAREVECLLPEFMHDTTFQLKGFLGKDQGVDSEIDISDRLLGDPESYRPSKNDRFVLAIGNMEARRRTVAAIQDKQGKFLTLVHPKAFVAKTAKLDEGVLVYPFATVSNNAKLACGVKLNYYASVGHDTQLGRYCLLAPYATVNGFAVLEDEVYLSTHSTVAPQVRVGSRSKLSANSAAMKDVPANQLVFGVPGRVVRRMDI
jgi:sugar O-acyltransferase (sialic acid O-acetyltransferase NeuD family)